MPETTDKIFVSYSRKEEAFARKLAIWLNKTLGVGVWIDVDDIPPGIKWSAAIQDGLDNCEVMIVVISPDAMKSVNVEDEWQYFLDQKKPVVPILLRSAPIPYQLRRIQYIDFSVKEEYNDSLRKLISELRLHLRPMPNEDTDALRARGSRHVEVEGIKPTRSEHAKRNKQRLQKSEQMLERSEQTLKMSNVINVVLALLLLGVAGGIIAFVVWVRSSPGGITITVEGSGINILTSSGETVPLEEFPDGQVEAGAQIITTTSSAVIRTSDSAGEVQLGPASSASVGEAGDGRVAVNLDNGTVSLNTEGTNAIVSTDFDVNINTSDGLDVQIDESSNTVRADCYEGSCTVTDADGSRTRELDEGNSLTFSGTERDFDTAPIINIPGAIAFVSYRHGAPEIYIMREDGSNQTRLTNNLVQDLGPTWSPDGTRIAYQTFPDDNWNIATINPNGGEPVMLTDDPRDDTQPAWSPDGTHIAFVSERDGNQEIYMMDPDGQNVRRLTDNAGPDLSPTWSPDGTRIAFVSNRIGNNNEIFVLTIDSNEPPVRLTNERANDDNPAWSPDGTHIAFDSQRNASNVEVYVMKVDGTEVVNISNDSTLDFEPSWSPDNTQLIFASQRVGNDELFIVPVDLSSEPRNLLGDRRYSDRDPAWLPLRRAGAS